MRFGGGFGDLGVRCGIIVERNRRREAGSG